MNIASIRGFYTTSGNAAYSASKAAIVNLTSVLAKQFAPNILVNAVAPGFTDTQIAKSWNEQVKLQAISNLLTRVAQPKEIAEAILFLAER